MRRLVLAAAALCAVSLSGAAIADEVKPAKLPGNLGPASSNAETYCQRKAQATRCGYKVIASSDYQAAKRDYTKERPVQPYLLQVELNTWPDKRSGDAMKGVSYEKSRKDRNKKSDLVQRDWLVEPKFADVIIWDTRFAFVQEKPGGDWSRLDVQRRRTSAMNGAVIRVDAINQPVQGFEVELLENIESQTIAVFAVEDDAGLLSIRRITPDGDVVGEAIDRVVSQKDMPLSRGPVEMFADGSLLVHRLDADGKVFDQVFRSDLSEPLTPALPPLYMASYTLNETHFEPVRVALLDVDASRNLFWPIQNVEDLYSKPQGLIGMSPLQNRYSITEPSVIKPFSFDRPSVGRYGNQLPKCTTASSGCEFGFFWFAAWDTPEGPRLAGVGKSEYSLPVDMGAVLKSSADALYVGYSYKGKISEQVFRRYFDPLYSRAMAETPYLFVEKASGEFQMMVFNVDWWQRSPTAPEPVEFKFYRSVPDTFLASEEEKAWTAAQSAKTDYVEGLVAQRTAEERRRQEAAIALAARMERDRQARVAQFRTQLDAYIRRNDYDGALSAAWNVDEEAVQAAVLAALRADARDSVTWADVRAASTRAMSEADWRLIREHQKYLLDSDAARVRAAQAAYRNSSATGASSSTSPSAGSQSFGSVDHSVEENLRWKSQLDYLSGKSSNYRCGSASFCN